MITIKQIYDNYPDSDLLPIEVTDETTLDDIEAMDSVGDTLFLFLCRELCDNEDDPLRPAEAVKRCQSAIQQINAVGHGLICEQISEDHASAMASHQPADQSG